MFKRVLVLVVFLSGVFWWLSNRGGEISEPEVEMITIETEIDTQSVETGETVEVEQVVESSNQTETNTSENAAPVMPSVPEESAPVTPASQTSVKAETMVVVNPPAEVIVVNTPVPTPVPAFNSIAPVVAPVVPQLASTTPNSNIPDRSTDVKVYVYDSGLNFMDTTLPAGTINFTVINSGKRTHDFNVSGFGILGKVTPSQTQTFTLKLPAGAYEAYSERGLDAQRGVRGSFTVVE